MQTTLFTKRRLIWITAFVVVLFACVWIGIAHFTGDPLILVFDVDGRLLLRRRGVFRNEDYPIRFRDGKWYIQRPDKIAEDYTEDPLPKTTEIAVPYKTRTLDGWYYILEANGTVRAVKEDGLKSAEVRYVDGAWQQMNTDGEWVPFLD